ncbi:DNA modification methylase [Abditibacterium utsteinense]|uniref:Methyltransferase n=1 Tax=Abditibacterium utsteinense TaxID=1960156 RepID=A0A2S8SWI1_9BACT|nr:site-specific DNA-methyltransferase [Abditibacterium utsteinense]PQV65153.1 DNA modification methylase [Abditibacterium utsteinense]
MNDSISARIYRGDARDLSDLRDGEVNLVVTSPPYWQIKDYDSDQQIGYGQSLHQYLFDLEKVWKECFRVLQSGRRLCINIGDQFARTEVYGRYKVIPLHCEMVSMCQSLGFDYMGSIIWQKKTTLNTSGGAVIMGSFPHPPNGVVELDYEHILLFKKPGDTAKIENEIKARSALTKEEWKTYFAGHWNFGGARQLVHEATFPDELPRRLIKMFSFAEETILDPFLGSGTTAKVALELNRSAVGFELNDDYMALIREKVCPSQIAFDAPRVEWLESGAPQISNSESNYRPHVEDARPIRDDKAERATRESEPLYKVAAVVNERTLRLESGRELSLLGVEIPDLQREAARGYLEKWVRGKQVFVRFDKDNSLENQAYFLLKNKIFINRKMIESGLATASNHQHKYREKFIKAQKSV